MNNRDMNDVDMNDVDTSYPDMNEVVGQDDILLLTLDTLRYDVACELAASGRIPTLASCLPGGRWEKRHAPGSFTYASHQAIFAGFLPTPASQGPHPRLFAARFAGSESTADGTFVFEGPNVVDGLRQVGYRTVCIGGVGFFNKAAPLGSVMPSMFDESYWESRFGVTSPESFEAQVECAEAVVAGLEPDEKLFLFVNAAALHQPNWFHLAGASAESGDTRQSHAAALEYIDRHIARLLQVMSSRRRCFAIVCSDHGTAYGDDGWTGHRLGHDSVWTVPYAHFFVEGPQR
ncbi:STM4013/SEN3800 family hydrolase [Rhodococcus globerulus]|uniref:STM4013/SEN3800 family hydrolase n=1 Tax=Rhodococcus globerulus TaxID=33008 RepID=UPI000AB23441|nr:STM4013/SEN3800 family hydrolase [Rhodococcus globerulus]